MIREGGLVSTACTCANISVTFLSNCEVHVAHPRGLHPDKILNVVYIPAHVVMFTSENITATLVLCRLCLSEVKSKHSIALFSEVGLQQNWPSHLRELLFVSVSRDDGLPPYICRSCMGKVETLERKLTALRQQAHQSIEKFQVTVQVPRKRPKDTSSEVGVSYHC